MAINSITRAARVDAELGQTYGRYAGAGRAQPGPAGERGYVRAVPGTGARAAAGHGAAALLGALIERMGGTADSRAKGSYVSLRI